MHNVTKYAQHQLRRGLARSTIDQSRYQLSRLHAFHHGDLMTVERPTIEAFLDSRRLVARSTYNYLSSFATFYRWAQRNELTATNPVDGMDRPRLRRQLPRPVTNEQLEAAMAGADLERRAWITLMAYAGLRCSEVARVERRDLISVGGAWVLHVVGKGGHERAVPAHPMVLSAMSGTWARTGPMFRRADGAPWSASEVSRRVGALHRSLGIDASAHQYRHWFGTNTYAASDGDLLVVRDLLGHASITTTTIYTAFSGAAAATAVGGLPVIGRPAA